MKKGACIRATFVVIFDDDEENDLRDQAIDAAREQLGLSLYDVDLEIVGGVGDAKHYD